ELVGLYAAATTWPLWMSVRRWGKEARQELDRQLLAQVAPDGTGREQSTGYLTSVFNLYAVVHAISRARGEMLAAPLLERLRRPVSFIDALTDSGGYVQSLGDTDSAAMPALDADDTTPIASMRVLAAAMGLCEDDSFEPSDAAAWLLGVPPPA